MMRARTLSGTVLAALAGILLAAGAVVLPIAPAQAAACSGSSGVTVVVDYNELGGGLQTVCDSDGGGKKASTIFTDSGFPLREATRQPGFVCRVANVPASAPCVNASPDNAFWSLWVSDGSGWAFANLGATSLTVPDGGLVGFSWENTTSGDSPPDISGTRSAATTAPQPSPSAGGTNGGDSGNKGGGNSNSGSAGPDSNGTPDASPDASPTEGPTAASGEKAGKKRKGADRRDVGDRKRAGSKKKRDAEAEASSKFASPGAEASAPTDEETAPTSAEPAADAGGLPGWVAPGLIVLLFAVAGGVMVLRRRSSTS